MNDDFILIQIKSLPLQLNRYKSESSMQPAFQNKDYNK